MHSHDACAAQRFNRGGHGEKDTRNTESQYESLCDFQALSSVILCFFKKCL